MNRTERLENLSAYLDGELSDTEARLLAAWCENHPEDVVEYEAMAQIIAVVRELPAVDPPAGHREAILRAVAGETEVTATREQAAEWLDEYLEGTLSEPRRVVVEHFIATDAAFAETVELHAAMLQALSGMQDHEIEPPADLKARIQAGVRRLERQEHAAPARRAPVGRPLTREAKTVVAVAALLALVAFGVRSPRRGGEVAVQPATSAPTVAATSTPAPAEAAPAAVADAPAAATPLPPVDDASQPVVRDATPAPHSPARAVRPRTLPGGSARAVANGAHRAPRNPARTADTERSSKTRSDRPAADPSSASKSGRKRSPAVKPAPLPGEGSGGVLAGESGRGSHSEAPELVQRRGNVSVLGSDSNGNRSDDGRNNRGAVDPTRRTETPPF